MSDSTQSPLGATDTLAGTETVIAIPPVSLPVLTKTPIAPFTGLVHKVTPSTIDPASHVRVWRDIVDAVGDFKLVVLDVSEIAEMNRRAVTAMVQCFKKLERNKIRFCLCAPQRQVEAMLELLGVLHLVESYATIEEATAIFQLGG